MCKLIFSRKLGFRSRFVTEIEFENMEVYNSCYGSEYELTDEKIDEIINALENLKSIKNIKLK